MVESEKPEPPSYEVAVECLEELETMLTTTAIKIEDNPVGKAWIKDERQIVDYENYRLWKL